MLSKRMSSLLKSLVAALIVLAALPIAAHATEFSYAGGYKPVDKTPYVVEGAQDGLRTLYANPTETLPSSYRSDEQVWAEGIRVKDQDTTGLCWAVSITSAAEYSYAKELYETTGVVGVIQETSPAHLAQFLYNRVNDPLGNTANDKNLLPAREHWALAGGNQLIAIQHMATWSGLCLEAKAPLEETTAHIVEGWTDYSWTGDKLVYADSLAYDDYITVQESIVLFNADEVSIKNLVYEYGAVSVSIAWFDEYLNFDEIDPETGEPYDYGRSFYDYDDDEPEFNHGVTIVGWDDSYPKENFTHEIRGMSSKKAYALTTPSRDGAWIVQNSWGDEIHDGGFIYVSYDSVDFSEDWNEVYAFDMQDSSAYAYNFQYDGTAYCADSSDPKSNGSHYDFYTTAGTRAANVFTNTTGNTITLEAVGFTTYNEGTTHIDVSVYTNLSDPKDPTSGSLWGTTRVTTETSGCKTAVLDTPAIVRPGTTFAIVISFPETNAFGVEMDYKDYGWTIDAETKAGQSFFSASAYGAWKDMNNYGACFRIKGFANVTDDVPYEPNSIEEIDGIWTKTDALGNPDYGYTGFAHNASGWWYVEDGIVTLEKTGFEQSDYGWFYIENSYVSLKKTGFVEAGGYWWYIENSYLSLKKTGLFKGGNYWWYVENSRIILNKNGVVKYQNTWWVVRNGRVDTGYNGTIVAGGVRWKVKNGKLVGRA